MTFAATYEDLFIKGIDEKKNATKLLNYLENELQNEEIIKVIEKEEIFKLKFDNQTFDKLSVADKNKTIDYFTNFLVESCVEIIDNQSQ